MNIDAFREERKDLTKKIAENQDSLQAVIDLMEEGVEDGYVNVPAHQQRLMFILANAVQYQERVDDLLDDMENQIKDLKNE